MEWISSWAGQIIVAVIIATLLEMILPEGKNKKYIKMVIGLYVVFTIISPAVSKASKEDWEKSLKEYENYFAIQGENSMVNEMDVSQNKTIAMAYEQGIKQDIKTRLEEKGYEVLSLLLSYHTENKEAYGTIQKIELKVREKENAKEEEIEKIKPVNKIQIGEQNETEETSGKLTAEQRKEIITLLTTVYEIQEDQIIFME